MSVIALPPKEIPLNPLRQIAVDKPEQLNDYLAFLSPTDTKGRYLHYDQLRFRTPKKLDNNLVWAVTKLSRRGQTMPLLNIGEDSQSSVFFQTPTIQKTISEVDRHTTTAAIEWMLNNIGEQQHLQYLISDFVQDEAISSSQLEGAATTTQVAKALLKRKRQPKTPDEKMILGNFRMMQFAWKNRDQQLSIELLLDFHRVGMQLLDSEKYCPGSFKTRDDVVVVDAKGNTLHTPPPVANLKHRLNALIDWINTEHHDTAHHDTEYHNTEQSDYIHPLVKAITLHFAIGYEHPFIDGNGRVARALFYWYLFKNDFSAFQYIAISVLLKAAPVQYGKSYLYSETDEMDLTYFIDYQCSVVLRAIATFKQTYQHAVHTIAQFNQWLQETNLDKRISSKQRIVLQAAKSRAQKTFTAVELQDTLGCSYNTAASVLNDLVKLDLFKKEKKNREWIFSLNTAFR